MNARIWIATLLLAAAPLAAQRHQIGEVNAETPEGQLLQKIGTEADAAAKLTLMEEFAAKHPKHEAAGWVLEQLQQGYAKAGAHQKTLDAGARLIALDPEDMEASLLALKAADQLKDAAAVRKWSDLTAGLATKVVNSPQPSDAGAVEAWKKSVEYTKQVVQFSDYTLYRLVLEHPDPKVKVEMGEALLARNPKSEYVPQCSGPLFAAYRQAGANEKAVAFAERVVATDQTNEELLLAVAANYFEKKQNPDKVHEYAGKISALVAQKPAPQGIDPAAWDARKKLIAGTSGYLSGMLYFTQNKFAESDKTLRAALPNLESNQNLKAEVLFHLGLANYKMEKAQDALNFNRACAAIKSPYQAKAAANVKAIMGQYRGLK